ncbi:MAG: hypothetical protein DDT22_00785 [candidate division WS2 bacterium]|nr:hypothetical protein [Candidatus Lithacetigena glycinireducens]
MAEKKITIEEKLQLYRDKQKWAPEAEAQFQKWEEDISYLQMTKEYLEHPLSREIVRKARDRIVEIKMILITKEDLDGTERKVLFAEKKAHETYLAIFSEDPEAELKQIERAMEDELGKL